MSGVARALSMGMLLIAAAPGLASPAASGHYASAPARAPDWWLVSGAPGDPAAIFADGTTLARDHELAQMRVLRIDRTGQSIETVQQIQCDRPSISAEQEGLRQFACASEKQRDRHGLLLAAMNPVVVAEMIFDGGSADTGLSDPRT